MNLPHHFLPFLWGVSLLFGNAAAAGNDSTIQPPGAAIVAYMVEFVEGYVSVSFSPLITSPIGAHLTTVCSLISTPSTTN